MTIDVPAPADRADVWRDDGAEYRAFFELAGVGNAVVDVHSRRFVRVNRSFSDITGYSEADLKLLTFPEITHPDDRERDLELLRELMGSKRQEYSMEKRYVRKDRSIVWAHLTTTLVRDEAGAPRLRISVIRDITARKEAEAGVLSSRAQLRMAIEAASLGTFYYDAGSGLHFWNERMFELLGVPTQRSASFEAWLESACPEDRDRLKKELDAVLATASEQHDFSVQFCATSARGEKRYLAAKGLALPAASSDVRPGMRLMGALRDVTDSKNFEQQLHNKVTERTAALTEMTSQLESFIYTVAHDLRAPLRAINGYAEFVSEDGGTHLTSESAGYVDKIKKAAQRLDGLIRDLMSYTRMAQVDLPVESVSLDDAVKRALSVLQGDILLRQAEVIVQPSLPSVLAERTALEQVIMHLLANAVKFVARGVRPRVVIGAETRGDRVRFMVTDNGIGIAPAYHDRVFRMFERLENAGGYPGTGIGLPIVTKTIERMGGAVGLESTPGQGSTFWIELRKDRR